MSLSPLPLSYCTNVHPGRSLDEVIAGLKAHTIPVRRKLGHPIAAGLWLAEPVIRELTATPSRQDNLRAVLEDGELICYTLNAFPFGDFHSERVKENVYLPDWTTESRRDYTIGCAQVLASLLPEGVDGSISTVPLGFKLFDHADDFVDHCAQRICETATAFAQIAEETGRMIRLAIEPEPFCILETTPETLSFFHRLRTIAADRNCGDVVQTHVGACYDVCHQAVEFEDVGASILELNAANIRINKLHISCAIDLPSPMENEAARATLAEYVEPRYLHQTIGRLPTGETVRHSDLDVDLCRQPGHGFERCDRWRIHFHVPVDAESLGDLGTTRDDLRTAIGAVRELAYAPHLEIETYTWEVLPNADRHLNDGLTAEFTATQKLLRDAMAR